MKSNIFSKLWLVILLSIMIVIIPVSATLAFEPQVIADGKAQDLLFIISDAQSFKNVQLKGESSAEKVNILINDPAASLTLSGSLTMESYAIGIITSGGRLKANDLIIGKDSTLTVSNLSQVEVKNLNISSSMFFLTTGGKVDITNTLKLTGYSYLWLTGDETTFTAKTMEIATSATYIQSGTFAVLNTVKASSGAVLNVIGKGQNSDAPSSLEINNVIADTSYIYAEKGASIKIGTGTLNNGSKLIATVDDKNEASSTIEINNLSLNGLSYLCAVNNSSINVTSSLKANNDGVIYAIYPESKIYIKTLSLDNTSELSARSGGYASVGTVTVSSDSFIVSRDVDVDTQIESLIEITNLTSNGTRIHAYEGGQIKIGSATIKNGGYLLSQGVGQEIVAPANIEVDTVSLSGSIITAQSGGTIKAKTVNATAWSSIYAKDLSSFIEIDKVTINESQIYMMMGSGIVVAGEIDGKNNSDISSSGAAENNYEFSTFIKAERINLSKSIMSAEDGGLILAEDIALSSSSTLEISSTLAQITATGLSEKKVILNFDVNSGPAGMAKLVYGAAHYVEHVEVKIEEYPQVNKLVGDLLVSKIFANNFSLNSSKATIKSGGALIANNIMIDKNSEIMCEEGTIAAEKINVSSKSKFTVSGINSLTKAATTLKATSMSISSNSWIYVLKGASMVISEDIILSSSELSLREGGSIEAANVVLKDKASFILAGICSSNIGIDSKSTLEASGSLVGNISNAGTINAESFEIKGNFSTHKGATLNLTLLKEDTVALSIDGVASFEGSAVTIKLDKGFAPVNGQEYLIISTTSGIEGTISTVKQSKSISGYSFSWGITEDNLGVWVKWYK